MNSKTPFYILVLLLIVAGIALIIARHQDYSVSWFPNETDKVWDIEARIQFEAQNEPVKVSLTIPNTQKGFTLVDEGSSSSGYAVSYFKQNEVRYAQWSIREAQGLETIYYKAQFLVDKNAKVTQMPPPNERVEPPILSDSTRFAAVALIEHANKYSADNTTFAREIIKQLNDKNNQNSMLILDKMSKVQAIDKILALNGLVSKIVGVIELEDGRRRQNISYMNQVWDNNNWQLLSPETADLNLSPNILIWDDSNISLLDVVGGENSQVQFSMIAQDISPQQATKEKIKTDNLLNFSIHSLPLEEQAMFKTIMLIPIGTLIVVFLRIIIGIRTSGTFMPVLIAMAFVQTQLLTGIIGFLLIVGTGLLIRGYLSKLNLLLVARISAVIIAVVIIISIFTVIAFKIGLTEGLSITFFPMIILSWTIERMSILWEEKGPKEVLLQGGGSLVTAILVYLAMTNPYVQHFTFNFFGLQLIVLALILLLGTYTGYRLNELRRFKTLMKD